MASHITLTINDNIATILLDRPKALNALTLDDYQLLATLLRRVAANDAVTITVITGTGKYFSAGADVHASTGNSPTDPKDEATRKYWLSKFAAGNIDVTKAFISHPKILIAALNGPVIGLSAALVAHCDFIYASQSAFILTPFASLGLVAEGASSYMFVKRMGLSLANSALITGARIPASRLLACGFVNEVFPVEGFSEAVQKHIAETFGSHLNPESMLRIKSLVRASYARELEAVNVMEHFEGLQRFAEGVPQAKFAEVSSGKRRHKL